MAHKILAVALLYTLNHFYEKQNYYPEYLKDKN